MTNNMSRTYRKYIKQGICTGSNTEFYRYMNRKCRQKNNHELRNLIANNDIETVNNNIMSYVPIHDSCNEPTDGTILINREYIKTMDREYNNDSLYDIKHPWRDRVYWHRQFDRYLKPKNRKHYRVV